MIAEEVTDWRPGSRGVSQECCRLPAARWGGEDSFTPASWSSPGVSRPSSTAGENKKQEMSQWWHPWSWTAWDGSGQEAPGVWSWACQTPQPWTSASRLQTAAGWSPSLGMRCLHILIPTPLLQFILNTVYQVFAPLLPKLFSCQVVTGHLHRTESTGQVSVLQLLTSFWHFPSLWGTFFSWLLITNAQNFSEDGLFFICAVPISSH